MTNHTVVFIDRNFIEKRYANAPENGDSFYTYGWGAAYARKFKKHNPLWKVECWKADSRIKEIRVKDIENVTFRIFPSIKILNLGHYSSEMLGYFKNFSTKTPSCIYNISSFDHLLFYSLAKIMKKQNLVVQNHGESPIKYKFFLRKKPINFIRLLFLQAEKKAFENIKLMYVLDKGLISWLPKTKNKYQIKIQTVGVDESIFTPVEKTEAKNKLNLDLKKKHLLYVGRLNLTKRPDILIDVYNELKLTRNDIQLILLGHEKSDILYSKAELSGAIMQGIIPQTELKFWLSAADIYFLPKYSDNHSFGGIGMLPVQSILCNTPVIGESLKNFPEEDLSEIGFIASNHSEIKNNILKIIDHQKEFKNIRQFALRHYSWEKITQNSAKDYLQLINHYDTKIH